MKQTCRICGEFKEHRAKGLCNACYIKEYRKANPRETIASLRQEMESEREKIEIEKQAVVRAINSLTEMFDVTCSYNDGIVKIGAGGKVYKVMVE